MRQEESGRGGPIGPLDWRKILPFEADAASDRLGWVGLEALARTSASNRARADRARTSGARVH